MRLSLCASCASLRAYPIFLFSKLKANKKYFEIQSNYEKDFPSAFFLAKRANWVQISVK
jgi:hypothetical protein